MKRTISFLVLLLAPITATAKPVDPAAVDAVVAQALKTWQVPGAAVLIIQDGAIVYLKGHGVRELGGDSPVTADTIFAIGSCTKAFTATAIGMLVDEGKMSWDDPVRKHVPYFHLADPLADEKITLRDLLSHRTGLARHDLLWYRAPWSIEDTIRKVGAVELKHSFRSTYEYNNILYLVAGEAVASASTSTWQEFVQKRLLDPLDMTGVVFTRSAAEKAADHASPHLKRAGKVEVIPWYNDDKQIRASGSIKTSARDLSKWVRFLLEDGTSGGKRLISAASLAETRTPQIVRRMDRKVAKEMGATQFSYGLGWSIRDYHGHLLIEHGGSVDGFNAQITTIPRTKTAVVVLANLGSTQMPMALSYSLLDVVLDRPNKDWNAFYADQASTADTLKAARQKAFEAKQQQGTKPSRELDAYTGSYEELAYGKVVIALEKGTLVLRWSSMTAPLEHFHFDTFTASEPRSVPAGRLDREPVVFMLGADAEPARLKFLEREFKKVKPKADGK